LSLEDEEHEMDVLQRMRQAIREQMYRISSHANDEMADDFLEAADIENIILTGEVIRWFTHDPVVPGMKCSVIPLTIAVRMSSVAFYRRVYY
jgi:hypothetical protein